MRIPKLRGIACLCLSLAVGAISPAPALGQPGAHPPSPSTGFADGRAGEDGRVALIVGNARYATRPLANPANDARAMARALAAQGFRVELLEDATGEAIRGAMRSFAGRLRDGAPGLFYFAGHGVRLEGTDYLVPVDVDPGSEAAVRAGALSLDSVLQAMAATASDAARLIVLDACRNNPFAEQDDGARAGLEPEDVPPGFLIAYATSPGAVAEDGHAGHGVYSGELLNALARLDRPIEQVFAQVGQRVGLRTSGRQVPWTVSALGGPPLLSIAAPGARVAWAAAPLLGAPRLPVSPARGVRSSRESQAAETAFWETIKDSENPAEYEAYLQAFPNGIFAPLARARIELYRATATEKAPEKVPPAPEKATPAVTAPARPAAPVIDKVEGDFIARTDTNVRLQPTTSSSSLGTLARGAPVEVLGKVRNVDWYQVGIDGGRTGYVAAGLLLEVKRPSPAAPAKTQETVAAMTQPAAPKVETPAAPAVGRFPEATGDTFRDCPSCPEMVKLPPGNFQMGADDGDASERPVHQVAIRKPFAVGRFEVTVAEWMACVAASACTYTPKTAVKPERTAVRNVSWDDAQKYTRWLSGKTGRTYRLPSEAEWEYAARAGTRTKFWWGDRPATDKANCKDCGGPWSRKEPAYVGTYDANPFGLHDMNGGVAEWTADCWVASHAGAPGDGGARETGGCGQRVLRGGSWRNEASYLRSASRFFYDANVRYLVNGFRVAADVE